MSAKKVLLAQYDLHNVLFNNAIDQVTEQEANQSIAAPMNSIKWLSGHLLSSQNYYAKIGGTEVTIPWQDHFASGPGTVKADGTQSVMPTLAEIKDKWNELHPQLRAGLENLPVEVLGTVMEMKHPIAPYDNTLGGLWAFINHHAAYTIGQLGILRRGYNKEAMKYS